MLKISPSPTLALDAKVKEMQKKGINVINLGIGEPDFNTPENIKKAAILAINNNFTHYTATYGIEKLRIAISDKLKKDNQLSYDLSEIVVGVGTKQILFHAFMCLCNKGDEVFVSLPAWSTYIEQIKLAGGKPVFKLSNKTKIILINSPRNPDGAVISEKELISIADLAVKKNIYVISDEIYEKIIYGKKHISIASLNPKIKKQTITINGFSKSYAMTGWRVGYGAGPKEIIEKISALQSQTTSNTCSVSQYAALEALNGSQKSVTKMLEEFAERKNIVVKKLSEIKNFKFTPPQGTFYVFVKINNKNSARWCGELLEKEKVAVVPGEAFLMPGYFRLSFAASVNNLKEGIARIKNFNYNYD